MHHSSQPHALFRIRESDGLYVDACLFDEHRQLAFLSLWSRDTAVQEFLGRLTLEDGKDGLTCFHLETDAGGSLPVEIGNVAFFKKRHTREMRGTSLGNLNHLWLFHHRCLEPDKINASALAMIPKRASDWRERLWRCVSDACPLPLLDHWSDVVLEVMMEHSMVTELQAALGPLRGFRVALDIPVLTQALGDLIRAGVLGVLSSAEHHTLPRLPLPRAA